MMNVKAYQIESNLILAQRGKTFFWAKFCLKQTQATDATRLYRFCRYIDDIADECSDSASAMHRLLYIIACLRAGESNDPIVQDAIGLFRHYQIEVDIPILLIEGVISDLDDVAIRDVASLLIYCYQVAGTVGIMMCKILGVREQAAYAHAIDLGIAMQLTNICRDVKEDAQLGRRYLPKSLVGNISLSQLIQPDQQSQIVIVNAIKQLLALAQSYYQSGHQGLCFLPLNARLAISLAATLYQAIGTVLQNNHYQYWQARAYVTPVNKLLLSLRCMSSKLFDPAFYQYQHHHSATLHSSLRCLPYVNSTTL